jgi:hypothetical protein
MGAKDLQELLERVDDTRELVLRSARGVADADGRGGEELYLAWSAANEEAAAAYAAWRAHPGRERYLVYLAAEDRADAAVAALARRQLEPSYAKTACARSTASTSASTSSRTL